MSVVGGDTSVTWVFGECRLPDERSRQQAMARQAQLTKPPGALGELEAIAIQLAGLQRRECPQVAQIAISIFAADHGIAAENVSAFPQAVTAQMVHNFLQGGAAISVLARQLQARLEIVDVGIKEPAKERVNYPGLVVARIAAGTANSLHQAAMSHDQLAQALRVGRSAVERALAVKADVFIGGEMGIANTTSATALYCALTGSRVADIAGAGTGLDEAGVAHKVAVIEKMLARHAPDAPNASVASSLELLAALGGFEIVALVGAYVHAAQRGMPVLVDGFISSVAAVYALHINKGVYPWLLLAHQSAEHGHTQVATTLGLHPLLNLGMRLGEGSGAAVAVPLLQQACALHAGMATFVEAAVAEKER